MKAKDLIDKVVEFEFHYNEDNKPRAQSVMIMPEGHHGGPGGPGAGPPEDGTVHAGVILRFDPKKGYGFLAPKDINEDVFFLRNELPPELRDAQAKDEVINREVEFEVKTMPDGKLRALRLVLTAAGRSNEGRPSKGPADGNKQDNDAGSRLLDAALVDEMTDFLRSEGGTFDYGKFANRFPRIKKKQLEEHFNVVAGPDPGHGRGQRIELRGDDAPSPPRAEEDAQAMEADAEEPENMDDPAIPLGPGCNPHGVIRSYDTMKGFGFIVCAGFPEDIYFPRAALPQNFQGKNAKEMPSLAGVQVSCEMLPEGDRGPRAEKVMLLVKWCNDDSCWLLKRQDDPTME